MTLWITEHMGNTGLGNIELGTMCDVVRADSFSSISSNIPPQDI
jgi:hypothetical protein